MKDMTFEEAMTELEKTVNESSGLYTYKDKTIASIVADAFLLKSLYHVRDERLYIARFYNNF